MESRYKFIISLIEEAGKKVLDTKDKHLQISIKNNNPKDVVTNVDIEISEFLMARINKDYPEEPIYSEEDDSADVSSGSFWSLDPIDGTSNFSRGVPHYAIVIAYIESGVPTVGAILNPITNELFSFIKGGGAFLNGKQVYVSSVEKLNSANIFFRVGRKKELWDWGTSFSRYLLEHTNKIADFGSSALDMCFVGAGRIEASIYGSLTTMDIAAAVGFVKEAGGLVLGSDGEPFSKLSKKSQTIISVNNHEVAKKILSGMPIL